MNAVDRIETPIEQAHKTLWAAYDLAGRVQSLVDRLAGAIPTSDQAKVNPPGGCILGNLADHSEHVQAKIAAAHEYLNRLDQCLPQFSEYQAQEAIQGGRAGAMAGAGVSPVGFRGQ